MQPLMLDPINTRELPRMSTSDLPFTVDELRNALDYNPETGIFTWKASGKARFIGKPAGRIDAGRKRSGYHRIKFRKRFLSAHRLAWMHVHGEWPEGEIDHINGIRHDNRLVNLRLATRQVNSHNRHGTKGYYFHKPSKKWRALMYVDKRQIHLGSFNDESSARDAHLKAKRIHHPTAPV